MPISRLAEPIITGKTLLFMSTPLSDLTVDELQLLLVQKRQVYEQMIKENKEFGQVKKLFEEIRDLEKKLQQDQKGVSHPAGE